MALITLVDIDNMGIPAVIFDGSKPFASADIQGEVELKSGTYTAKAVGYDDTTFNADNDKYVLMKSKGFSPTEKPIEIVAKKTTWKKWVKLGVIALGLFGLIKLLIKK
jgi:hypothetical protein